MMRVNDEITADYIAELETECQSFADEAAEWKLRAEELEKELRRLKAAYPELN